MRESDDFLSSPLIGSECVCSHNRVYFNLWVLTPIRNAF